MDARNPSYAFRPRWSFLLLMTVVLLPASFLFFAMVIGIPIGLFLIGLIGMMWYLRLWGTMRLEFRSLGVFVPSLFKSGEIAYDSINRVSIVSSNYQNFIRIDHDGGQCQVSALNLPSNAAFQEVYKLLAAKIS